MSRSLGSVSCNDLPGFAATLNDETSAQKDLNLESSTAGVTARAEATSPEQRHQDRNFALDCGLVSMSMATKEHELQQMPASREGTHGLGQIGTDPLASAEGPSSPAGQVQRGRASRLISVESRPSPESTVHNGECTTASANSSIGNDSLSNYDDALRSASATAPLQLCSDKAEHSNGNSTTSQPLTSTLPNRMWRLQQLSVAAAMLAAGAIFVVLSAAAMQTCLRQFLAWLAGTSPVRHAGAHDSNMATGTMAEATAPLSLSYTLAALHPTASACCAAAGMLFCARMLRDVVRRRRRQGTRGTPGGASRAGVGADGPSGGGPSLAPSHPHPEPTPCDADPAQDLISDADTWSPFATKTAPRRSADAVLTSATSGGGAQSPSAAAAAAAGEGYGCGSGGGGCFRHASSDSSCPAATAVAGTAPVTFTEPPRSLLACNSPSLQNWAMPSITLSEQEELIMRDRSVGEDKSDSAVAPLQQVSAALLPTADTAARGVADMHDGTANSDTDGAAIVATVHSSTSASGTLVPRNISDTTAFAAISQSGGGDTTTSGYDINCHRTGSVWRRVWSVACRMALPGLHLLDRPTCAATVWERSVGGGGGQTESSGRSRRPSGWGLPWPRPELRLMAGGVTGVWPQLAHNGQVTGNDAATAAVSSQSGCPDNSCGMCGECRNGIGDSDIIGGNAGGLGNGGAAVGVLARVSQAVAGAGGALQSGLLYAAGATLAAAAQLLLGGSSISGPYAVLRGHGFGAVGPMHPRQSNSSVRQMVSDLLPLVTGSFLPRTLSDTSLNTAATESHGNGGDGAAALLLSSPEVARKPAFSDLAINAGRVQVLSVDDEPVNQQVMRALLWAAEYEVLEAASGEEALDMLRSCEVLPDLVLLDVTLGGQLSGFEVCRDIRCEYSPGELPVIMITCSSLEEDVIRGLAVGANDYMIKPLRNLELMARIKTQLALKRSIRVAAEARVNMSLLGSILPANVIRQLKQGVTLIAQFHEEVTILFSDIRGFTNLATEWPTEQIILMLNNMFTAFDRLCDEIGVYKVETIGDAYMIVSGHDGVADHAARMLRMATAMLSAVADMRGFGGRELQIRVGIHTGPAHSGVVGRSRPRYCFFGDTVNTASRMESTGFPMAIQVSESTLRAINSRPEWAEEFNFVSCGPRDIKGKGVMYTYLLQRGLYNEALLELAASAGFEAASQQLRIPQPCLPTTITPASATTATANGPQGDGEDNPVAALAPVDAVQVTASASPDGISNVPSSSPLSLGAVAASAGSFSTGGSITTGPNRTISGRVIMASPFAAHWPVSMPGTRAGSAGITAETLTQGPDSPGDLDFPRYASYRYHHPVYATDGVSSTGMNTVVDSGLGNVVPPSRMEGSILGLLEDTGCTQHLTRAPSTNSGGNCQPPTTAAVIATNLPTVAAILPSTCQDVHHTSVSSLPPSVAARAVNSGSGGSSTTATSSSAAGMVAGRVLEGPMGRSGSGRAGGTRMLSSPASTRPSVDMLAPVSTSSNGNDDPVWGNGQATTTTDTGSLSTAPRNGLNVSISCTTSGASAGAGWAAHSPPRDAFVMYGSANASVGTCRRSGDVGVDEPTFHGRVLAASMGGGSGGGGDKVSHVLSGVAASSALTSQRSLEQPSAGSQPIGTTEATHGIGVAHFKLRRSPARTSSELSAAAAAAVAATGSNVSAEDDPFQGTRAVLEKSGCAADSAPAGFGGGNGPSGGGETVSGQMVGWSLLVHTLDPERSLSSNGVAAETLGEWMNGQRPAERALHSVSSAALSAASQPPQPPSLQALRLWHANDVCDISTTTSGGGGANGLVSSAAVSGGFLPVGGPSIAMAAEALAAAVDSALYDSIESNAVNSHAFGASGLGSAGRPYSPSTNVLQGSSGGFGTNRGRQSIGSSLGRGGVDVRGPGGCPGPFGGLQTSSNGSGSGGPHSYVGTLATDVSCTSAVPNEGATQHPPPTANPHASRLYLTSSQGGVMFVMTTTGPGTGTGTRPSCERPSDASSAMMTAANRPATGLQQNHHPQHRMVAAASGPTPTSHGAGTGGGDMSGGDAGGCTLSTEQETHHRGASWDPIAHHRRALTATVFSSAPIQRTTTVDASYFISGGESSSGGGGGGEAAGLTAAERRALNSGAIHHVTTAPERDVCASKPVDAVVSGAAAAPTATGADSPAAPRLLTAPPPLSHVYRMDGSDPASRRKSADVAVASRLVVRAATVQGMSSSTALSNTVQAAHLDNAQYRHSTSSGQVQTALRQVHSARWPQPHHVPISTQAASAVVCGGSNSVLSSYSHIALGSGGGGVSIISQGWSNLYDPSCARPRLTDHYASGDQDEPNGAQTPGSLRSPSIGSGHHAVWDTSPVCTPIASGGGSTRTTGAGHSSYYRGGYREQFLTVSRPSLDFFGRASSLDVEAPENAGFGAAASSVHGSSSQQVASPPKAQLSAVVEMQHTSNIAMQQKAHVTALGGSHSQTRTRPRRVASMQRYAYDKIVQAAYHAASSGGRENVGGACVGSPSRAAAFGAEGRTSRSHSFDINCTSLGGGTVTENAAAATAATARAVSNTTNASRHLRAPPPSAVHPVYGSGDSMPARPLMGRMSMDTSLSLLSSQSPPALTFAATTPSMAAMAPSGGLRGFEHLENYQRLHSMEPNWGRWRHASATGMTSSYTVGGAASAPTAAVDAARCNGLLGDPRMHPPLSPDADVGVSIMTSAPGSAKRTSAEATGSDRIIVSTVAVSPRANRSPTLSRAAAGTSPNGADGGPSPVIPAKSEGSSSSRLSATIRDTVTLVAQHHATGVLSPFESAPSSSSPRQHQVALVAQGQRPSLGINVGVVGTSGAGPGSGSGAAGGAKYSAQPDRHSVDIPVASRVHMSATPIVLRGNADQGVVISDGGQSATAVLDRCGLRTSIIVTPPSLSRVSDGSIGSGGGAGAGAGANSTYYQRRSASTSANTGCGSPAGDTVRLKGELRRILEPSSQGMMQQSPAAVASGSSHGPSRSPCRNGGGAAAAAAEANMTTGAGSDNSISATTAAGDAAAGLDIACMLARASERSAGITAAPSHSASTAMTAAQRQSTGGGSVVQLPPTAAINSLNEPVAVVGLLGAGMPDVEPVSGGVLHGNRSGDMDSEGEDLSNTSGGGEGGGRGGGGGNPLEFYQQHAHHHTTSHQQHRLAHSYGVSNGLIQALIPTRLDPVDEGCGSSAAFTGEMEDAASVDGSGVGGAEGAKERGATPATHPRADRSGTEAHSAGSRQPAAVLGQQGASGRPHGFATVASEMATASTARPQMAQPAGVRGGGSAALMANDGATGLAPLAPVERGLQAKHLEFVSGRRSFSTLVQKVKKALRPGEGTGRGGGRG